MTTANSRIIFDCLRKAVQPSGAGLSDGQLLRHYVGQRDEAAFAVLVRRHGPMVLAVCRRLLGHVQDAEDAFQAAFVILARKGHRIAQQQTIGGWLHGVACHVARDARRRGGRRRTKEQQVTDMPHPSVMPEEDQRELLAVLDRELTRLPDKYRLPVVLCELEGRSRKEAARQLGLPEGTLSSRLATARKKLAKRMSGQGLAVTAAALTALFASEARAVVSGPLVASTVRAAGGAVSAGVVALAEGVLKAMLLAKIKGAALVVLAAVFLGAGGVTLTYAAAEPASTPKANTLRATTRVNNDDLETLRRDVEALRADLEVTRAQVKVLEAEIQVQKTALKSQPNNKPAQPNLPGGAVIGSPEGVSGVIDLQISPTPPLSVAPPPAPTPAPAAGSTAPVPNAPPSAGAADPAAIRLYRLVGPARLHETHVLEKAPTAQAGQPAPQKPAEATSDAAARVRAAAEQLRIDPTNKQALEALIQAAKQVNHPDGQRETPSPK